MANDTGFYETNINTFFFDGMFKYHGFSFMWEYANRDADDPIAIASDAAETGDVVRVGDGLNLQAGLLLTKYWEVS
ncbi:MAG: hypothetical protein QM485_03200 [Flavobacteriaceae bacterium]